MRETGGLTAGAIPHRASISFRVKPRCLSRKSRMNINYTGKQLKKFWASDWGHSDAYCESAQFQKLDGTTIVKDDPANMNIDFIQDDDLFCFMYGWIDLDGKNVPLQSLFIDWLSSPPILATKTLTVSVGMDQYESLLLFLRSIDAKIIGQE